MTVNQLLAKEIEVRIIDCGIHPVIACIEKLEDPHLQYRPNDNSNSINNLVLHLDGNVRQWLLSTLSDAKDNRKRNTEFDRNNVKTKTQLIEILRQLEKDIRSILPNTIELDLVEIQKVQCFEETNLSIIVHVIEHFSYHVGQITYITKMILDIDTGYYSDLDLEKTG